ncbi:hypothetical protein B0H19DRAFT_1083863 [Mycena capillaripes]|nr:hypothetical protein B0H19DRAFT_1083863 [Mycena capillaripes]
MWPAIFVLPAGLLLFGFSIANHKLKHSYIGATVGMTLTCFAVQMITTPIIACAFASHSLVPGGLRPHRIANTNSIWTVLDCVDCYKPQSAEVVQLLNFVRQGFWSLRYGDQVGFRFSGLTYACVSVLFFLPVLWIMFYGERLRARLGEPGFNKIYENHYQICWVK